ncbi:hypothetical protein PHLCEN_2v5512 [Hermanssonia centrifuga]|uniref:Uncharacterized protein n=1 Tax=Hermanssonia centrifuga TaxID=98765 RepID=A0A2R6P2B0_9APHY|nr:hypothetical protein PHLCEN_2v5512 [Hermanssonia centrifuga]
MARVVCQTLLHHAVSGYPTHFRNPDASSILAQEVLYLVCPPAVHARASISNVVLSNEMFYKAFWQCGA